MQDFAIGLHQAPGVARSLWPPGDDLFRTIQIEALQDVPKFVAFADKGQYINNPPFEPKELKNDLAVILQTYVVTQITGAEQIVGITNGRDFQGRCWQPAWASTFVHCALMLDTQQQHQAALLESTVSPLPSPPTRW
ncbi:MAG: hypothetical protein L6R36_007069 [Xanthoria steineri]|nr:MAG: hypothetical protein L6R36_007069 [Xanthoria steineri]